jgi:hypothetical protein
MFPAGSIAIFELCSSPVSRYSTSTGVPHPDVVSALATQDENAKLLSIRTHSRAIDDILAKLSTNEGNRMK